VLTIGQVGFGVLAAYAFARMEFPGRDWLFSLSWPRSWCPTS
jgi:ABC-type glycerol-3-phosphate transport system permease component